MKKSIFLILATILCATNAWAWCGNSFITVNGLWCTGSNGYVHEGGKFDGKDLGELTSLVLGGELQVWPSSEEAATMYYSIDNAEAVAISLPKTGMDGENSKHSGSATVDLSALAAGEHTLAVWFNHGGDWDSNNSNNFVATFTIPAPTYDFDIVVKDLTVGSGMSGMLQFNGTNSLNADMFVDITLFATEYGTYSASDSDSDPQFNGFYAGYKIYGNLTYSYSEELKSDLIVVEGTINDGTGGTPSFRLTMYNEYIEPTDVVVLNNLQKTIEEGIWNTNLRLFNTANDTIITIVGCDGTYGKYSAYAMFGEVEVEGKGQWKNAGENDVFEGVLFNADTTVVFQVTATTPAPTTKEYEFEILDVTYNITEMGALVIEGEIEEECVINFELEGWNGSDTYELESIWGDVATVDYPGGQEVTNGEYEVEASVEDGKILMFFQVEDELGNTYFFYLEGEVPYQVVEDEITNFVFDTEAWPMVCAGGPSTNFGIEVYLVLTEEADGTLSYEQSSVSIGEQDVILKEGILSNINPYAPSADAVLRVQMGNENYELHLTMSAAPAEPTNVVISNAVATYDEGSGALKLTGLWEEAEVFIEIAGYDGKESVDYNTPQGILFETPDVVAFGNEAKITVTGEDITVVCEGLVPTWGNDVFNVTITTLAVGTALDNVTTTVAPVKAIVNGQLVIIKNGVQYNAQGAVVK